MSKRSTTGDVNRASNVLIDPPPFNVGSAGCLFVLARGTLQLDRGQSILQGPF